MVETKQGTLQNWVRDLASVVSLAVFKTLSWQTTNGLHSPRIPSFLDSRVRTKS